MKKLNAFTLRLNFTVLFLNTVEHISCPSGVILVVAYTLPEIKGYLFQSSGI